MKIRGVTKNDQKSENRLLFQNKSPAASSFSVHSAVSVFRDPLLHIVFVLINHRCSAEQGESGEGPAAAGPVYLHPTFLAPSVFQRSVV